MHDDTIDTTDKCMVVDWYYKKHEGGRMTLHFIKFCEGNLLLCDGAGGRNGERALCTRAIPV